MQVFIANSEEPNDLIAVNIENNKFAAVLISGDDDLSECVVTFPNEIHIFVSNFHGG